MKIILQKRKRLFLILSILVILEILCTSHFVGEDRGLYAYTSLPFFLLGIIIPIIPLIKLPHSEEDFLKKRPAWIGYIIAGLKISLLGVLGFELIKNGGKIIDKVPIGIEYADMLPIIKVMCQRFIYGQEIYTPIPEIFGGG